MADDYEQKLNGFLKHFADRRNSVAIALVANGSFLDEQWAMMVRHHLMNVKADRIDIIVDSIGGDIGAAYSIAELLRTHSKTVTSVVPRYAMSAATLICMGADEILVDECSQLGPLDAQIPEKKGGQFDYKSALNPFKALDQLREFTLESLDVVMKLITTRTTMTPKEALDHATQVVETMNHPLFCQLETDKLGEYSRALVVAKEYATRLLSRYSKLAPAEQYALIEKMVYGYPSHDFIIDYKEMLTLKLPVQLASDQEQLLMRCLAACFRQVPDKLYIAQPGNPQPAPSSNSSKQPASKSRTSSGNGKVKRPAKPQKTDNVAIQPVVVANGNETSGDPASPTAVISKN